MIQSKRATVLLLWGGRATVKAGYTLYVFCLLPDKQDNIHKVVALSAASCLTSLKLNLKELGKQLWAWKASAKSEKQSEAATVQVF